MTRLGWCWVWQDGNIDWVGIGWRRPRGGRGGWGGGVALWRGAAPTGGPYGTIHGGVEFLDLDVDVVGIQLAQLHGLGLQVLFPSSLGPATHFEQKF